jgi:hypothetical protein
VAGLGHKASISEDTYQCDALRHTSSFGSSLVRIGSDLSGQRQATPAEFWSTHRHLHLPAGLLSIIITFARHLWQALFQMHRRGKGSREANINTALSISTCLRPERTPVDFGTGFDTLRYSTQVATQSGGVGEAVSKPSERLFWVTRLVSIRRFAPTRPALRLCCTSGFPPK